MIATNVGFQKTPHFIKRINLHKKSSSETLPCLFPCSIPVPVLIDLFVTFAMNVLYAI